MTTFLKRNNAIGLATATAVAVGMALPALAGGFDEAAPGLKGTYGHKVAHVPAPAPIPELAPNYYFRADGALGFNGVGGGSETGMLIGTHDAPGATGPEPSTFGGHLFNSFNDFSGNESVVGQLGVGVGKYWNDWFRTDITAEYRTEENDAASGSYQYMAHYRDGSGAWVPIVNGSGDPAWQVNGTVKETLQMRTGVFMANAYFDILQHGHVRPYIGGGVGFARRDVRRVHASHETYCDPTIVGDCDAPHVSGRSRSEKKEVGTVFAGQLSAGLTVDVWDHAKFDIGYRFQYIDGMDVDVRTAEGTLSSVSVGETQDHQLRAGLRWDIE